MGKSAFHGRKKEKLIISCPYITNILLEPFKNWMIPHKYLTVNKVNKGSSVQVTSSKNVRIGTQGFCVTTSISIFVLLKSTATTKSDFKCAVDIFLLPKVIARDVWLFKCALLRLVEYGAKLDGITCSVE